MLPCATKCATCGSIFDPARIRRELAEIETKLADPALWSNPNATKPLMRDHKRLENLVADDDELVRRTGDIEAYFELAREGEDVLADLERDIKALAAFTEDLEARTMLNGEADPLNAIVTVHPGAGGTESQDWAEMLMRMYLRWAEQQGFKTEMNDYQDGEEAGIKSATFTIIGEYAFGQLAGESGVHRLVRISPFDSGQAPAYIVCVGLCFAGDRRHHSGRSEAGRSAHRYLPLRRQGRPAREYHRLRRAHDAPAHRNRGAMPERALAAQEPREGDEDAALAALRIRA